MALLCCVCSCARLYYAIVFVLFHHCLRFPFALLVSCICFLRLLCLGMFVALRVAWVRPPCLALFDCLVCKCRPLAWLALFAFYFMLSWSNAWLPGVSDGSRFVMLFLLSWASVRIPISTAAIASAQVYLPLAASAGLVLRAPLVGAVTRAASPLSPCSRAEHALQPCKGGGPRGRVRPRRSASSACEPDRRSPNSSGPGHAARGAPARDPARSPTSPTPQRVQCAPAAKRRAGREMRRKRGRAFSCRGIA